MTMSYYLFICLALFAIGDFLGVFTKARVSSVFVALMLFLIGFISGILPPDIIEQAGLSQISKWAAAYIVFHMGTMINWDQLKKEWRTVTMSIIAMAIAFIALLAVSPIIGMESALVSIPIVNGGIVATQIMTNGAMEKGLAIAAALGTVVYAVQKFVGTPPASYHGLSVARKVVKEMREKKAMEASTSGVKVEEKVKNADEKVPFYVKHDKYYTDFMCLGITGFFAFIAHCLGSIKIIGNFSIHFSIWALILGILVSFTGMVPPRLMEKGKASGLLSMALFASIIPSLAKVNIGDLWSLGFQTIVIFVAVIAVTYIVIYFTPVWKIVGSKELSVGIAMAQLLGFPATYLISHEIATAVAETPEEKEAILQKIMPAYVVAGFISVTSLSIIIAGILVEFL